MTQVKLTTNHGDIVIELNADKAPITVANFIEYVKAGHYENTVFHRVIGNFMIQGGGFEPGMKEKKDKRPSIQNEADNGLSNEKYTVAMARTMEPHSASAQFFINVADSTDKDTESHARREQRVQRNWSLLPGQPFTSRPGTVPRPTACASFRCAATPPPALRKAAPRWMLTPTRRH